MKTTVCAPTYALCEVGHGIGIEGRVILSAQSTLLLRYQADATMNIIYSSDNYYVVEYPAQHGYELVDKNSRRGTFFQGDVADRFAQSLQTAVAEGASVERVDEFLDSFDVLLNQPLVIH